MTKKSFTIPNLDSIKISILEQEIEALKQEKDLQKEEILKGVEKRLVSKNMAFPVIRDVVDLPEEEIRGIFYGTC